MNAEYAIAVRTTCSVERKPSKLLNLQRVLALALLSAIGGCGGRSSPSEPAPPLATVTLTYQAPTALRPDLPASVQGCVKGATPTHTHPSWRGFAFVPLAAVGTDLRVVVFDDVPIAKLVSLRINDPNACDENPTGAVTRNVFINGVLLTTPALTPGTGQEPGFSFTVANDGQIHP